MTSTAVPSPLRTTGVIAANEPVSAGLLRLDVALARDLAFAPGQFVMLNLVGEHALVFGRPFSILAADAGRVSFLYRVVGRGTAALRELTPGARLWVLGPLGQPFPPPDEAAPAVLVAGGVGLPPLAAWRERWGGPRDLAFFGARDGADVPWAMLDGWRVSVDDARGTPPDRAAFVGVVTDLVRSAVPADAPGPRRLLACGPLPLLAAARRLAAERGWACWVSLEEQMGCGYGVCKGCVVRVHDDGPAGWRNATCCQEGPVFASERLL